ncbi:unnamed protein product [Mytilus edulis]|uniref:WSC domain-containing protein n=1 Tax=Mytilus edulis TaxID=6550 RepID=A0A8S3TK67_MYTED|nr:unnamed protein product [Mytilus edulis]
MIIITRLELTSVECVMYILLELCILIFQFEKMYMQDQQWCLCDTNIDLTKSSNVTDSECNTPCNGNLSQMCGGNWRLSLYRIREVISVPSFQQYGTAFHGRAISSQSLKSEIMHRNGLKAKVDCANACGETIDCKQTCEELSGDTVVNFLDWDEKSGCDPTTVNERDKQAYKTLGGDFPLLTTSFLRAKDVIQIISF